MKKQGSFMASLIPGDSAMPPVFSQVSSCQHGVNECLLRGRWELRKGKSRGKGVSFSNSQYEDIEGKRVVFLS
jgi:hypothetical protein